MQTDHRDIAPSCEVDEAPLIRPLLPTDAPVLRSISESARQRYNDMPRFAYVAKTPPVALSRFQTGTGWVAEGAEKILGYALVRRVDSALFLDNISTRPDAKGMRLGAKLMSKVLLEAARDGFEAVTLTTFREPPWNGPWFRRLGFVPLSENEIGPELAEIVTRQATYLDASQREVLARPLTH